jgi:hypothetical protein
MEMLHIVFINIAGCDIAPSSKPPLVSTISLKVMVFEMQAWHKSKDTTIRKQSLSTRLFWPQN